MGRGRRLGSELSVSVSLFLCFVSCLKGCDLFGEWNTCLLPHFLLVLTTSCWLLSQVPTYLGFSARSQSPLCLQDSPEPPEAEKEMMGNVFVFPMFCQDRRGSKDVPRKCPHLWDFYHPGAFWEPGLALLSWV
jgi:hypothetical protein